MNLTNRPRRLRNGALLRSMVRETRISADTLIYPMFVQEGEHIREEIPSMPGQYRWSLDCVDELLQQVVDSGVKSVLLFGIPAQKMRSAAVHGSRTALSSRRCGISRAGFRSCMSSPMSACASIRRTDTAAFSADMTWTTTRHWKCWQKQHCPMCRLVRIWLLPRI